MRPVLKVIGVLLLAVGCFALGWFTSTSGYRVVDAGGQSLTRSNAAQTVKDENARLEREVVGLTEQQAQELLERNDRTFWVGVRDGGKPKDHPSKKTFTNLTVEVKDGKVVKSLGWF